MDMDRSGLEIRYRHTPYLVACNVGVKCREEALYLFRFQAFRFTVCGACGDILGVKVLVSMGFLRSITRASAREQSYTTLFFFVWSCSLAMDFVCSDL